MLRGEGFPQGVLHRIRYAAQSSFRVALGKVSPFQILNHVFRRQSFLFYGPQHINHGQSSGTGEILGEFFDDSVVEVQAALRRKKVWTTNKLSIVWLIVWFIIDYFDYIFFLESCHGTLFLFCKIEFLFLIKHQMANLGLTKKTLKLNRKHFWWMTFLLNKSINQPDKPVEKSTSAHSGIPFREQRHHRRILNESTNSLLDWRRPIVPAVSRGHPGRVKQINVPPTVQYSPASPLAALVPPHRRYFCWMLLWWLSRPRKAA